MIPLSACTNDVWRKMHTDYSNLEFQKMHIREKVYEVPKTNQFGKDKDLSIGLWYEAYRNLNGLYAVLKNGDLFNWSTSFYHFLSDRLDFSEHFNFYWVFDIDQHTNIHTIPKKFNHQKMKLRLIEFQGKQMEAEMRLWASILSSSTPSYANPSSRPTHNREHHTHLVTPYEKPQPF